MAAGRATIRFLLVVVAVATLLRARHEVSQLWARMPFGTAGELAARRTRAAGVDDGDGHGRATAPPARAAAGAAAAWPTPEPIEPAWPTPEPVEIELTHDAVKRAAGPSGVIIATFANFHHLDFALNWAGHLRLAGLHNYFVGCTDDELRDELVRRAVRCARIGSSMARTEATWGSAGFAAMGRTKGALVGRLLALDAASLLFLDLDAVLLRDPLPYLLGAAARTGAELLMHSDALLPSAPAAGVDDGAPLEDLRASLGPELNTGLFWVRSTNGTRAAADAWAAVMADDAFFAHWKNDQQAFNQVLRARMPRPAPGETTALAFGGRVRLGVLPVHLFASGHTYMVQRLHERYAMRPFAVHVTFVNCDSPGKRSRLREEAQWLGTPDGDEHADAGARVLPRRRAELGGGAAAHDAADLAEGEERFLAYDVDLPAELTGGFAPVAGRVLAADDEVLQRHWRLMNHQLRQLRRALGLALATNRTLLLPRLLCGLETVTNFAHAGVRCADCGMALPYLCPTDHVLRMHYWAGSPPSGPKPAVAIATREYSFLEGPRRAGLAARLSAQRVDVSLRAAVGGGRAVGARRCELPQCASPTRRLLDATPAAAAVALDVPADGALLDTALREALAPHAAAPLLRLTGLTSADVRFGDAALGRRFEQTVMWLPGGWCCSKPPAPGKPGHFFYDMYWDALPHTDRWGRRFVGRWEALPGP